MCREKRSFVLERAVVSRFGHGGRLQPITCRNVPCKWRRPHIFSPPRFKLHASSEAEHSAGSTPSILPRRSSLAPNVPRPLQSLAHWSAMCPLTAGGPERFAARLSPACLGRYHRLDAARGMKPAAPFESSITSRTLVQRDSYT
jgi:hypothetical protein